MRALTLTHTQTHADTNTAQCTWRTAVHQRPQRLPCPPVLVEVGDGHVRDFVLDPAQQTLLGGLGVGLGGKTRKLAT